MKESIVKNIFKIVSSFSIVLLLAACGSIDIIDDDENEVESEKLSTVSVKARAASEEENVYPIRVYTFAENGNLKSNNLIKSAQETVSLRLPSSVLSYVVAVSANEDVFSFSAAPYLYHRLLLLSHLRWLMKLWTTCGIWLRDMWQVTLCRWRLLLLLLQANRVLLM